MKRSTLAAAVVLAALGSYILWLEREGPVDANETPVFLIEEDEIERIEIRRRNLEPIAVERNEDSFRLVAPIETAADATEVGLLLQNLQSLTYDRVVAKASEVNLADFGLELPSTEVLFRIRGDKERSLAFGSDTPTASNQYARRDGSDEILVVRSHLSLNFDKSAWDLRDKSIFDAVDMAEFRRVEIARPGGTIVLERENGLWYVIEPRRSRADRYQVTTLASRFRAAEMSDIVSESGELDDTYGLDEPTRSLEIALENEESAPLRLEVGAQTNGGFYARTPSRAPVFLLGSELVGELDRLSSEFESKKLFEFSGFEVIRFSIETRGGSERIVEREASGPSGPSGEVRKWKEIAPESGRELDQTAVEDFLYALNGASASEILPEPGIEHPDFVLTVWSKDRPVEERARVAKGDSEFVTVHREGDDVVLKVTQSDWSRIEELVSLQPKVEPESKEVPEAQRQDLP